MIAVAVTTKGDPTNIGEHRPTPRDSTRKGRYALCDTCERPITLHHRGSRVYNTQTYWQHDRTPKWVVEGRATP